MKKYILINEETGKRYERATIKRAERLQNDKALEGIDLCIYVLEENGNMYLY